MQLPDRRVDWHEVIAMIDSQPTLAHLRDCALVPARDLVDARPNPHGIAEHDLDQLLETLGFDATRTMRLLKTTLHSALMPQSRIVQQLLEDRDLHRHHR